MRSILATAFLSLVCVTSASAGAVFWSNFNDFPTGPFNPPAQGDSPSAQSYWYPSHTQPAVSVGPYWFKDQAIMLVPDKTGLFNMFGYTSRPFAPSYRQILTIWEGVFVGEKTSINFSLSFDHETSLGGFLVRDRGIYRYGDNGQLVKIGAYDPTVLGPDGNLLPHSFIVLLNMAPKVPYLRVTYMQGSTFLRMPDIPVPEAKALDTAHSGYLTLTAWFDKQDHPSPYVMHNVGINANFPKH